MDYKKGQVISAIHNDESLLYDKDAITIQTIGNIMDNEEKTTELLVRTYLTSDSDYEEGVKIYKEFHKL
tara:strand:- start:184 stop:390 length:207 start_codon:yes stop_codon:yes gene_type:complete